MNGNSTISKEMSAHAAARHTAPRWRMVFALVLALSIGSAGQTAPAQAAPASELVNFTMTVVNPKTRLKCNETVTYLVKVEVAQADVNRPTPPPGPSGSPKGLPVMGIKVEAFSTVTSVGDFVDAINGTATNTTTVVFQDDLATLGTKFKFKANKVGKTTLWFQGLVGKEYVTTKVDVKVIPCKIKVKTLLEVVKGEPPLSMITDDAVMTPDASATFTGSTTVHFVYGIMPTACGGVTGSATDTQVALTGRLDEEGQQFMATETFGPTTVTGISMGCGAGSKVNPPFTLTPLTFTVASSGGVSIQSAGYGFTARIIVIPEEDKAAAFNPGNHEASVGLPSPRWAMRWDDFSSLFSTLLALR